MLYRDENWLAKEHDKIRLQRNDPRMVRWMCNVRPEDRISVVELGIDCYGIPCRNVERIEDCFGLVI